MILSLLLPQRPETAPAILKPSLSPGRSRIEVDPYNEQIDLVRGSSHFQLRLNRAYYGAVRL
jgi:hypothetical protein